MVSKLFETDVYVALKKAIDAASLKHRVTANNIANVDTPAFKKADVAFEEELKMALERADRLTMKTTHPKHIQSPFPPDLHSVQPKVVVSTDTTMRNDLNNVDIDVEMAKMTDNNIMYNTLAQLIADKIRGLKNIISEGKG